VVLRGRQIQFENHRPVEHRRHQQEGHEHREDVDHRDEVEGLAVVTAQSADQPLACLSRRIHGRMPLAGVRAQAGAASLRRSVMLLRNFTDAISRLSTSCVVLVCSTAWISTSGTATIRPNAVQFIATEMLDESRLAFSAGFTVETAANALIRPMTVPSRPRSV